jgi:hypothetical protein
MANHTKTFRIPRLTRTQASWKREHLRFRLLFWLWQTHDCTHTQSNLKVCNVPQDAELQFTVLVIGLKPGRIAWHAAALTTQPSTTIIYTRNTLSPRVLELLFDPPLLPPAGLYWNRILKILLSVVAIFIFSVPISISVCAVLGPEL